MIVLRRGTHPPSFGAVWTVALEILKPGPHVAPLLAGCLLLARPPQKKLCTTNLLKQLSDQPNYLHPNLRHGNG